MSIRPQVARAALGVTAALALAAPATAQNSRLQPTGTGVNSRPAPCVAPEIDASLMGYALVLYRRRRLLVAVVAHALTKALLMACAFSGSSA